MFATAKMLHEIGHAVAARRAGAAEGLDFVNFRWGISFMFLLPTPYVDVSSAWLLENRWRRAQVGLAGIEVDLFVAAIAALVWVEIGEGFLADRLFEVVLLCGASSLLFNANPLVRLDGYYVLSDLIGIPNLQTRGWAALRNLALFPLGLGTAPARASDLGLALYSAASWAWRWSVFAAIFWIASGISPNLGYAFATVIGILYLGIPIARGIGRWCPRPGMLPCVARSLPSFSGRSRQRSFSSRCRPRGRRRHRVERRRHVGLRTLGRDRRNGGPGRLERGHDR